METKVMTIPGGQNAQLTERTIQNLSMQYANRGIALSAKRIAEKQEENEKRYFSYLPEAFRKYEMSEEEIESACRHGKRYMDSSDLVEYIEDSRVLRIQKCKKSTSGVAICNELSEIYAKNALPVGLKIRRSGKILQNKICTAVASVYDRPATKKIERNETKRFPLSVLASTVAVFLCLILVFGTSAVLGRTEQRVESLKEETVALSAEVESMKEEVLADERFRGGEESLFEKWREKEGFLESDVDTLDAAKEIEVFETKEEKNIGLNALLSAFGIK